MIYRYEHFGSIRDMLETLEARPVCKGMEDCKSSHREMSAKLCDSKTWEDALALYHGGKAAPRGAMKAIKAAIDGTGTKRTRERAYAGSTCNVARAVSGLPKDMYRRKATPAPVRKLRIVYNSSTACSTTAQDMERAGNCLFRVAYSLSRAGVQVEIVVAVVSVSCDRYKDMVDRNKWVTICRPKTEARGCYVTVKGYNEMFNPAKLSFALCSPSLLRRFGVLWLERAPFPAAPYKKCIFWLERAPVPAAPYNRYISAYNSGYGRPVTYNPAGVESLKGIGLWDENTRYFSVYDVLTRDCDATRVMAELIEGV